MPALRIIIIRHCDKPTDNSDRACNDTGYLRANKLAGLTGSCTRQLNACTNTCQGTCDPKRGFWGRLLGEGTAPSALFAAVPQSVHKSCTKSNRMCLVLAPTAYCYKMTINPGGELFCSEDNAAFAKYLMGPSVTGTVIVAWEHKNIMVLIEQLGISNVPEWPKKADDRYDLVFDLHMAGPKPLLYITTQGLGLPGDSVTLPKKFIAYQAPSAPAVPVVGYQAPSGPAVTVAASRGGFPWKSVVLVTIVVTLVVVFFLFL